MTGSVRGPILDESQPCAGQIDGVALASALRFSTLVRTDCSRDSRPSSSDRSKPNVSSGLESAESVRAYGESCLAECRRVTDAAHRARFHERGQLFHRPGQVQGRGPPARRGPKSPTAATRSDRRVLRSRCGSWSFRVPGRVWLGIQAGNVTLGLPGGPDPDEYGQRHHRARDHHGGSRRDRHSADHAGRTVSDQNGVTP